MKRRSIDYHRVPVRIANRLLGVLNGLGIARASLEEEELLATAKQQTGLEDFGPDQRFLEPMRLVLEGLESEAQLNPIGRHLARMNVLRLLKNRLLAAELLKKHPEILERKLGDPVVVVGLGRSGTTRLHRLLAADERFLHLESWESVNPVPYEDSFTARDRGEPESDPRITGIDQALKAVLYMAPQVGAVHPLGTHEVEEELGLLQHSFSTQIFETMNYLPGFAEWLMTHDQHYAYEYMVVLLKIISWFRGDPEGQPWVLKTPQHMQDLDALMRVFPNARLVCSHRDPIKVLGSLSSMTWNSLVRDSDMLTPEWIGPYWLDKTERMLRKTMRVREQVVPAANQYDIQYADITADWQQAMEGVYQFLGLPLTDQARQGMQSWLTANAQHKHGSHRYELEDFGLNADEVDSRLAFYRETYDIPYETRNPHLVPKESSP